MSLVPARACGLDLQGGEGDGDLTLVEMHLISVDDSLARNDVMVDRVERRRHAAFEAALDPLAAADPEVHRPLDEPPTGGSEKPAALGGFVR